MLNRFNRYHLFVLLAVLSLWVGLLPSYYSEEGVYTVSSFEMLFNHNYYMTYLGGNIYGRPPLYNWCILGVARIIGYSHMLLAARIVTITATIGSAAVTYGLARVLTRNPLLPLLAVLSFLSGDLLFRRSWIAYADPTFAFFISVAILCMWFGYSKNQQRWLWLVLPLLSAAFLTKALTCYVFYGMTVLILLIRERRWQYFFHPISLTVHIATLAFPLIWFFLISENSALSTRMTWDVWNPFADYTWSLTGYVVELLNKILVYILRWAPLSFIVLYAILRKNQAQHAEIDPTPSWVKTLFYALCWNVLPYFLTPGKDQIRYLLPLYPFISVLCAYVLVYRVSPVVLRWTMASLVICIGCKLLVSPWGVPWFSHMSPNFDRVAQEIMHRTRSYPLYATDNVNMIGILDALRYPAPPLVFPDPHVQDCFYIGDPKLHPNDTILHNYILYRGYDVCGIFCRGKACNVS